jgi:NADPH:quinone reductase-like Zn-dependent oxidoreductase
LTTYGGAVPVLDLNDGSLIPRLGFGVFMIDEGDTREMVTTALTAGYRHVAFAALRKRDVDIFFRRGDLSRSPPFIPALEVAGTIRKLRPAVPINRSSRGTVSVRPGAAVVAAAD